VQDELTAIEQITRVLGSLPDHETRVRVITWISERFSQGFPGPQHGAADMAAAHRPVDSGLSFPDDLFDPPVIGTLEASDLHGVFDPPAEKPHAVAAEPLHRAAAERAQPVTAERPPLVMVVKPEAAPSAKTEPAVIDAPADDAADHAPPPVDRRQLTLLLLADMTPPAALATSVSPNNEDAGGESPPRKAHQSVSSKRHFRTPKPPASKRSAPVARPRAAKVEKAPAPTPPPADDSMEALLRSLVADFRELADEWGNT